MKWFREILAPRQLRVLDEIGPTLSRLGFHLAGGTAVALQLGHRRSVDLDWFSSELNDPLQLADEILDAGIAFKIDQYSAGTLHGSVQGVRVSLLRYRYPMLQAFRRWPGDVRIAGRRDLAAMKLSAIARRGAKKDFVDIYALGRKTGSLTQMLEWYQEKHGVSDVVHVCSALGYFVDADRERMPKMLWKTKWRTVKITILQWLRAALKQ